MSSYALVVISVLIAFLEAEKVHFRNLKVDRHFLVLALSTIGAFVGCYNVYQESVEKDEQTLKAKYSKDSGTLKPKPTGKKFVQWESHGDTLYYDKGFDVSQTKGFEEMNLKAWIENDTVRVNAEVRDSFGKIIVRIKRNEWVISSSERLDKNFDDQALEVIDNGGNIIFQLEIFENIISFQGLFYLNPGKLVIINKMDVGYGLKTVVMFSESETGKIAIPLHPILSAISPLFKYPTSQHMGEREKIQ